MEHVKEELCIGKIFSEQLSFLLPSEHGKYPERFFMRLPQKLLINRKNRSILQEKIVTCWPITFDEFVPIIS